MIETHFISYQNLFLHLDTKQILSAPLYILLGKLNLFYKDTYDGLAQFLHHDRRVLRYFANSALPEYPHGKHGNKKFIICFYLADNSIEVRDVRDTGENKGAHPK